MQVQGGARGGGLIVGRVKLFVNMQTVSVVHEFYNHQPKQEYKGSDAIVPLSLGTDLLGTSLVGGVLWHGQR